MPSPAPVVDTLDAPFGGMQPGHRQRRFARIDAGNVGTEIRERLGHQSAAAADVQRPGLLEHDISPLLDVVQTRTVDVVQRLEVAVGVPPTMRQRLELGDLIRVDVDHVPEPMSRFATIPPRVGG